MTATAARTRTGLRLQDVDLILGDGDAQVAALDAVSLTVAPGELVAVVGPSGAGKSSLLAVAGGLTQPDRGRVCVDDVDIASASASALARYRRERVGFVFQSGNLIPALTATDQLRYALRITGRRGEPGRDPLSMLEHVGMTHRARSHPHQLSGGERQRVGIARALVTGPSILLVDEPTAALDRARSHEIMDLLARETHERGVATIVVTHDHDVLEHCDRVLQMVDGKLTASGWLPGS
jgi:putative ABC transport system ATP-binding protein